MKKLLFITNLLFCFSEFFIFKSLAQPKINPMIFGQNAWFVSPVGPAGSAGGLSTLHPSPVVFLLLHFSRYLSFTRHPEFISGSVS